MSSSWLPPRLRSLLGPSLDQVGIEQLQRLIGLVEDTDLEFKSACYDESERADTKEAALDLTGFANAHGGLIVFGIAEDGAGTATGLNPVQPERDFPLWLDQVSASRIFPAISIGILVVESDTGFVYLVSIPPSPRAPHAMVSAELLRYPVRAGRHRRFMSESEVADQYGRRFIGASERAKELDSLLLTGKDIAEKSDHPDWVWMIAALVPDIPGSLQLQDYLTTKWNEWVPQGLKDFPCYNDGPARYRVSLGYRALVVHDSLDSLPSTWRVGGELRLDGSGVLAYGYPADRGQIGILRENRPLYDEFLVSDLINGLGVLAQHALRTGAGGAIQVTTEIVASDEPIVLAQYRSQMPGPLPGSRPRSNGAGPARHSLSLEGSADRGPDRLSGVRLLASDLFSAFGIAEPPQINNQNQPVLSGFHPQDFRPRVDSWARRYGFDL